jgi:hypothetical protein
MERNMSDADRRVEMGFDGGLILVVRIDGDQWSKLETAIGAGGHVSIIGEEAAYVIDTSKISYVKVETSTTRVGF